MASSTSYCAVVFMINLCPLTVGVKRANRSKTPGGSGPHGAGKGGWSVVRAREARRRRRAARGSTAQRVASTSPWGPANRQASHRPRKLERGGGGVALAPGFVEIVQRRPLFPLPLWARAPNTVGGFPDPASRQVPPLSSPSQFPSHPPPRNPRLFFLLLLCCSP